MSMSEIDPSQPIFPLRTTKYYPVPPVCTAFWTEDDWERTARTFTEPYELESGFMGRWRAVGRRADGVLLYTPISMLQEHDMKPNDPAKTGGRTKTGNVAELIAEANAAHAAGKYVKFHATDEDEPELRHRGLHASIPVSQHGDERRLEYVAVTEKKKIPEE